MGISLLSRYTALTSPREFSSFTIIIFLSIIPRFSVSINFTFFNRYVLCSYCGAQIFEVYGLGKDIVDLAFRGSVSKIGGLTMDEVSNEKFIRQLAPFFHF